MANTDTCRVGFALMERFVTDVFRGIGVPDDDARLCADVLITADKRGIDSHGVGRLKPIYYDRIVKDRVQSPATRLEIVRDHAATAVVDGHHGMGMVIAASCMRMAIEKARRHGIGIVTARNSTHYGIAGYYALMACEAGMIGFTSTNARPSIAPTFGVENMLGTNPLTIGIPTDEPFPFVIDCATSIAQRGKIEVYARAGKPMPRGWVVDEDGGTTTDAAQALIDLTRGRAALTPLGGIGDEDGGHKGYGYATVVEILSAALQDGAYLKMLNGFDENHQKIPYPLGHFFMAINVEEFIDLARFQAISGDILRQLRASRKARGQDQIFTPGEKEHIAWEIRTTRGCPVPKALQQDMETLRKWYSLPHRFPWD